jgi:hypothetical protein
MSNYLDFFPYSVPTYSTLIVLPTETTEYMTVTKSDIRQVEKQKTATVDIDIKRLTNRRDRQKFAYSIKELKSIAKNLGIKGSSTMNKENLVKFIKIKIKD